MTNLELQLLQELDDALLSAKTAGTRGVNVFLLASTVAKLREAVKARKEEAETDELVEVEIQGTVQLSVLLPYSKTEPDGHIIARAEELFEEHVTFDANMEGQVLSIIPQGCTAIIISRGGA